MSSSRAALVLLVAIGLGLASSAAMAASLDAATACSEHCGGAPEPAGDSDTSPCQWILPAACCDAVGLTNGASAVDAAGPPPQPELRCEAVRAQSAPLPRARAPFPLLLATLALRF
jgi:hypothetical protein